MADWWPTRLDGDPTACGALAARLHQMAAEVDRVTTAVSRRVVTPVWIGTASESAAVRVAAEVASGRRVAQRMRMLGDGVRHLAGALSRAAADLDHARTRALSDGLAVTADGFTAPAHHPAARAVRDVRDDEFRAHQALAGVLRTVTAGPLAERLVSTVVDGVLHLPGPDDDLLGQGSWLVGLPGAADLLSDTTKARLRAARVSGVARALGSDSPHVAGAAAAVTRVGPMVSRVAKAAGPVGNVLTVVTEGQGQWQADADDPRLSTADRIGRTATRATLGGAVAIEGALVGASLGSAIPVVGTAAGAVVGAAVGSFAASELGRSSVDAAVEGVDDAIDLAGDMASTVGEATSRAAGAASDAADAVGDAAGKVADKVCFWK
ncbi:hypothetical protein GCM10011584_26540 [Nocardioides phosphati]|uniref:WXG100 family type VII secretion target n=1 Tax=Nocardioides phosphati TaxID=1867775 RepID=A0ABQ2NEK9_9ACTN|nr:hypothetical protein GCM10011584_26540 [Nocardioides phosphati]